jgi:hypothetical protein
MRKGPVLSPVSPNISCASASFSTPRST